MTAWGPPRQCGAIAPDGQQCALAHGHEENHLNAYDVTRVNLWKGYRLQATIAVVIVVMLFVFSQGSPF